MGRPERPIDPDGGPVAEFARDALIMQIRTAAREALERLKRPPPAKGA